MLIHFLSLFQGDSAHELMTAFIIPEKPGILLMFSITLTRIFMAFDPRIQKSVTYLEEHLFEPLELERVAAASGFSLSHFYRLFLLTTGFSVREFIRNKRLAAAAGELIHSRRRVLDIALDCGFESQEVFTRAFQALYGVTPVNYRRNRRELEDFAATHDRSAEIESRGGYELLDLPVTVRVEEHERLAFVGMSVTTSLTANIDENVIPRFWEEEFVPHIHEIRGRVNPTQSIGFERLDPSSDQLYHLACFQVEPPAAVPPGMTLEEIAAGTFAIFTPARPLDPREYSALVRYAFGEWLPISGYLLDGDFTFDRYTMRLTETGIPECVKLEVFVPVTKPLKA
jgi:AraC family transcriptional regulator